MDATRRTVLLGVPAAAAVVAAGLMVRANPESAAPTMIGPWAYVPPGASIRAAMDDGAVALLLGAGTYSVPEPIMMRPGTTMTGVGQQTRLVAAAPIERMIGIGNKTPTDGVQVSNLVLDCATKAQVGLEVSVSGSDGHYQREPDAVIRLDDLWVYDPASDGVLIQGSNARACTLSRIRVRRARRNGFNIAGTDNWLYACEATTSGSDGAGFYIAGSNNILGDCKAWYSRGHGFHVTAVRQQLTGCQAQDVLGHGFLIEAGQTALQGCVADSCSSENAGGKPGAFDGFYVADDASLVINGCLAYDRRPTNSQGVKPASYQRWGFNVPRAMVTDNRLLGVSGYDNLNGLINLR